MFLVLAFCVFWFMRPPATDPVEAPVAPTVSAGDATPERPRPTSRARAPAAEVPAVLVEEEREYLLSCAAGSLPSGPIRYSPLERYAAALVNPKVVGGKLEARTVSPSGAGDLVVGGERVARVVWTDEGSDEPQCSVIPVPLTTISGRVVDPSSGGGLAGAQVSGCGAGVESGPDGAYTLEAPEGLSCSVRAVWTGPGGRMRTASGRATAPGTLDLELDAPRTVDDLRVDVVRAATQMEVALNVQKQLEAVVPGAGTDETERTAARIQALDAAAGGEDPQALRDAWLGLDE